MKEERKENKERSKRENSNEKGQRGRVETSDHKRRCVLEVERNKVGTVGWNKERETALTKVRTKSLI